MEISNLPPSVPIRALLGATLSFQVTLKQADGQPLDLADQQLQLIVRAPGSQAALLTLGSPDAGISISGNVATITVTPANLAAVAAGKRAYTLTRVQGSVVTPVLSGAFEVRAEVA